MWVGGRLCVGVNNYDDDVLIKIDNEKVSIINLTPINIGDMIESAWKMVDLLN